jgi:nucleotide-binding universal stress UspA family protein
MSLQTGEQAGRPAERVFLVVVDESPEMRNALRYACRRAKRTGGRVAMLYVMEPPEGQQWGSVVDLMRQEARQEAEAVAAKYAEIAATLTGQPPAIYIREGKSRDELIKLITEDRSICVLVLGSSSSGEGPGPLVTAFAGKSGSQLRIPLTIVPGALTEAEIDAIS